MAGRTAGSFSGGKFEKIETRGDVEMSKKTTYYCDLCGNEIVEKTYCFGLHFNDMNTFTLGAYGCTDGTHICYGCARQLKKILNNCEIEKYLANDTKPATGG